MELKEQEVEKLAKYLYKDRINEDGASYTLGACKELIRELLSLLTPSPTELKVLDSAKLLRAWDKAQDNNGSELLYSQLSDERQAIILAALKRGANTQRDADIATLKGEVK